MAVRARGGRLSGYVVTGGGRGIGRAVVERLLAAGHRVVSIDRDDACADGALAVAGDAADEALAERAAQLAAPLAGWVNNAAVFRDASLHDTPPDAILDLIALNLRPALVGCAVALRHLGDGGAIVNVSSHQARAPVPGCTPYATAKAAIEGLTRALAAEYGARGIRVNAVALGTFATGRDDAPRRAALHALERVGRAEEAAAAIAYLLSPAASFITGTTLPVDGGRAILGREP